MYVRIFGVLFILFYLILSKMLDVHITVYTT